MEFLNSRTYLGRHDPFRIRQAFELSPTTTGEDNHLHIPAPGGVKRLKLIGRIATGSEEDQDIACLAQGFNLSGKDLLKTEIIGNAGQGRTIRGQADGGESTSVVLITPDEFLA